MKNEYALVRIMDVPYHGDKVYEYYIPREMSGAVSAGSMVSVPFGRGNRKCPAVVTEVRDSAEGEYEIKPVSAVLSAETVLNEEELRLCRFMCDYTLCTFGEAVRTVIPPAAMSRLSDYYTALPDAPESKTKKLSEKALIFYAFIKARERVSASRLKSEFGDEAAALTASLCRLGLIGRTSEIKDSSNIKYNRFVSLAFPAEELSRVLAALRSPLQAAMLKVLAQRGELEAGELFAAVGSRASAQLSSLEKKALVTVERREDIRNPYREACDKGSVYENTELSREQSEAVDKLSELFDTGEARAALLHGVTGSGKTRVIKAVIDKVTGAGRGVIVLVPEISLTPQTVGIFCSCYGERVAVLHSALSQGERYDAWRRIRRGEADVVIGTRSAVFAPVKNLGMIVIDEEQEHTYKSDTDPKYLAHDIARYRCGRSKALMLLSSATPSLHSYYKAVNGSYTLVELKERYGGARLPRVIISDMRAQRDAGDPSPVTPELRDRLAQVKMQNKQAVVFLNRRGYNSAVICRVCGEAIKCPSCSVSLTYHTKAPLGQSDDPASYLRIRARNGGLACHYCGYRAPVPRACPACGAEHFRFIGCGTQQAQEELERLLPGLRVARMDMDTTSAKQSYQRILDDFGSGKKDVLLGTQMVTKGHDFPNVTLVGVMNADAGLMLDDYRAAERTFSMLTQVIGRAGRADSSGVAVIQTFNPDSEVIRLAAKQDYKAFYEREIGIRRALTFPPFCDIGVINLSSGDEALLAASSVKLSERVRELLAGEFGDVEAVVFGPFEAPVYKVQNSYRMRLVVKCRLNKRVRQLFSLILREFGQNTTKRITVTADFNPTSF